MLLYFSQFAAIDFNFCCSIVAIMGYVSISVAVFLFSFLSISIAALLLQIFHF